MHTVEILEQALELAGQLGYAVRQEWLAGSGGGACEVRGRKLLFLDLDLGVDEQLDQVLQALRGEPRAADGLAPPELRTLLIGRNSP
jgi:hypothetical protein